MTRPAPFFEPPELELRDAPSISEARPLDSADDDMKAIGATLLDALRLYLALTEASAAQDKLAAHTAANKLQALLTRRLPTRVARIVSTVNRRT